MGVKIYVVSSEPFWPMLRIGVNASEVGDGSKGLSAGEGRLVTHQCIKVTVPCPTFSPTDKIISTGPAAHPFRSRAGHRPSEVSLPHRNRLMSSRTVICTTTKRHHSLISLLVLPPLLNPIHQNRSIHGTLQSPLLLTKSHFPPIHIETTTRTMSSTDEQIPEIILRTRAAASGIPGEQVEPRQTLSQEDQEPDPSKSIPLSPARQKLIDDVIALYSCQPNVERVSRYAPGRFTIS